MLEKHGVSVDPAVVPKHHSLQNLTEADWANTQNSPQLLSTLYAASKLRREEAMLDLRSAEAKRRQPDPRYGHQGLVSMAKLRSMPLIHGTTADGFASMVATGEMQTNKGRYEASGENALDFHSSRQGATTLLGRQFGLDDYVFFDFGRPSNIHSQGEITIVMRPELIQQPGSLITERDIQDCLSEPQKYMDGASTPEYFYDTALLHIAGSQIGQPQFSAYEVKLREVPVNPQTVAKVIVRDQAVYDQLSASPLAEDYNFELVPELIPAQAGQANDEANYNVLQIPGAFEAEYARLTAADFEVRNTALSSLDADKKEQVIMIFPTTSPDEKDPTTAITTHTAITGFPDTYTFTYHSWEELKTDAAAPLNSDAFPPTTRLGRPAWSADPYTGQPGLPNGLNQCVVAIVERSKQNPALSCIRETQGLSLDELHGRSSLTKAKKLA